jgi:hypothetical protein
MYTAADTHTTARRHDARPKATISRKRSLTKQQIHPDFHGASDALKFKTSTHTHTHTHTHTRRGNEKTGKAFEQTHAHTSLGRFGRNSGRKNRRMCTTARVCTPRRTQTHPHDVRPKATISRKRSLTKQQINADFQGASDAPQFKTSTHTHTHGATREREVLR